MLASDSDAAVRVAAAIAVAQLDEKEDRLAIKYLGDEAEHGALNESQSDAILGLQGLGDRARSTAPLLKSY